MQTNAVVITAPHQVGIQPVTLKPLAAGEVAVATRYTSISAGTERMLLAGQMPHPMLQLPVVPGYETVGEVVELGSGVDKSLLGKLVYVGGSMCYSDVNAAWGGQSERLHVSAERALELRNVAAKQGVMLALSATSLHGVDNLNPQPYDRILVLGQGPVGQLAARFLTARGATVVVTDRNAQRLDRAHATQTVNVSTTSLRDVVDEPFSAIIDATGSMDAITEALPHLKTGGTILLLGYYHKIDLPYMPLFLKEARLLTAKEWAPGDLRCARNYIEDGTLDVAPLITHEVNSAEITSAYDTALNDDACLKLVINWSN